MFDIGWSELIIVAVVALIAIGPKELPGVLRMVGQWMAKIRRMAADFQGQFNEAMREAEMADIKKQFDEIKDTAKSFTGANLLSDAQKDFDDALKLEDKPAAASEGPAASAAAAEPAALTPAGTGPVDGAGPSELAATGDQPAVAEPPADTPVAPLPPAESGTVKAS